MNVQDVHADIVNKTIRPLYVLHGAETGIRDVYVSKISEQVPDGLKRVDSVAEIYQGLSTNSLLKMKRNYVIADDYDFAKKGNIDDLFERLEATGSTIVLTYNKYDPKSVFGKSCEVYAAEFERMDASIIAKYASQECELSEDRVAELVAICDAEYSRIIIEVAKLKSLATAKDIDHNKAYDVLVGDGLIRATDEEVDAFKELVAYMNLNDLENMFEFNKKVTAGMGSVLGMLTILFGNYEALLAVADNGLTKIGERTGINYYRAKDIEPFVRQYSFEGIIEIMQTIHTIEKGIKSGLFDEAIALDYLACTIVGVA